MSLTVTSRQSRLPVSVPHPRPSTQKKAPHARPPTPPLRARADSEVSDSEKEADGASEQEDEGSAVSGQEGPSVEEDAAPAAAPKADAAEARLLRELKGHGRHFSKIAGRYTFSNDAKA